jgi:putative phage-type endonuclease
VDSHPAAAFCVQRTELRCVTVNLTHERSLNAVLQHSRDSRRIPRDAQADQSDRVCARDHAAPDWIFVHVDGEAGSGTQANGAATAQRSPMITMKQREDRAKGIGSSDAPVILGVDPFRTPHDLWLQKTGRVPPVEENDAMRLGSVLEPVLLQLAGERLSKRVVRPTSAFVGCFPHFRANIDGMVGEAKRGADIVEVKTTSSTEGWGAEGTDEVPERVRVQVIYQMACASSDLAHVACLSGAFGLAFRLYRVEWDASLGEYVMGKVNEWWMRHIVKDEPPPESGSLDTLKSRMREVRTVELPQGLFIAEAEARMALEQAERYHTAAKAALVTAMGDASRGVSGNYSVSVTDVVTDRFDRKSFEAENAELASRYIVPSGYKRIDIRTRKGSA